MKRAKSIIVAAASVIALGAASVPAYAASLGLKGVWQGNLTVGANQPESVSMDITASQAIGTETVFTGGAPQSGGGCNQQALSAINNCNPGGGGDGGIVIGTLNNSSSAVPVQIIEDSSDAVTAEFLYPAGGESCLVMAKGVASKNS